MKLYGSHTSPFMRYVRVVVGELGLTDRVEIVISDGTALDPEPGARGKSPLRKIPFLETSDGRLVLDSRVIAETLTAEAPGQTLLPADGPARVDARVREALAIGFLDVAVGLTYERRLRPAELQWPAWIEAQWRKMATVLNQIDAAPPPADRFDIGDCALAAAPPYLDLRYEERGWRERWPNFAAWWEQAKARPSVAATLVA